MNDQARNVLRVLLMALFAVIVLKLLGLAINIVVSIVIPVLLIYFLYKVLIKKEDIFK
ncbi:hypothetical protein [Anaerococcus hydrogenalis]|uniref:Uncharacterized protein n=2 Tax=Anaerococcus hydrogenalis TaxID=33029 RepID=F0H036_9FIRM|nr:hypothetical protein [Anaerococcus hydrogenalis]EEB35850.1 hypothetical protein ANHYDRO_01286 [Anaerococcus hydrogenalis DSM 7454]EGC84205.1 hypothetical protein HMPREF9246_0971 [Anaerococcus hydrogenalis ACS-025-V-Sch4]MBS5989333.1 hypothetical protein [Anaerococcus hydrogenalis]MDK7695792.1 hypothetical protein [Anaerococcus hydrogenalis]MDK7697535.1 hypothetical protein [Anaerococcus hydrogenalis]